MEKPLFFTDLDTTLIYSKRFLNDDVDSIVTEYNDNRPLSYMTKNARNLLNEVVKKSIFIPVSTRSYNMMSRIKFIEEINPEWMICDNGIHIYHNGVLLNEWETLVKEVIPKKDVSEFEEPLHLLLESKGLKDIVNVDNTYLVLKFEKMTYDIKRLIDFIHTDIKKYGYYTAINSRKGYILPLYAKKEAAVSYLRNLYSPTSITISAGDSLMDLNMLKKTDYSISPKHRTFIDDSIPVTKTSGLVAGEEILTFIKNMCDSM